MGKSVYDEFPEEYDQWYEQNQNLFQSELSFKSWQDNLRIHDIYNTSSAEFRLNRMVKTEKIG